MIPTALTPAETEELRKLAKGALVLHSLVDRLAIIPGIY